MGGAGRVLPDEALRQLLLRCHQLRLQLRHLHRCRGQGASAQCSSRATAAASRKGLWILLGAQAGWEQRCACVGNSSNQIAKLCTSSSVPVNRRAWQTPLLQLWQPLRLPRLLQHPRRASASLLATLPPAQNRLQAQRVPCQCFWLPARTAG